MNKIEQRLKELNPDYFSRLMDTKSKIDLLLKEYSKNFPTYTDHSLNHTQQVFELVSEIMNDEEITNLNPQELFVLSMASLLHDIGMCIPEEKIGEIETDRRYSTYKEKNPGKNKEELIRDLHHELSYDFIMKEYENLNIPTEKYAEAIALTAKAHRKVELLNFDVYKSKFFVKSGREFVCLPYLGAVLRLADELDVSNSRTPDLLTKYYLPNNEDSRIEWEKHRSTFLVNMDVDTIIIEAKSNDQNVYNSLQTQFTKVQQVLEYCQKVIHHIGNTNDKKYTLALSKLKYNIKTDLFPKEIKFSIDVENVISILMGKNIYDSEFVPIRELIQNALDSCLYKKSFNENYQPQITIELFPDKITCEDNGLGMDEYIIEKYFSKLSSSFYQSEKLESDYKAIGRFGIGVFSYFTIADYIDVETKKKDKAALKFRTDKDPNNYFYFYDAVLREEIGTKVTLHYSNKFKDKSLEDILCYILDTFKFIDVSMIIKWGTQVKQLQKCDYRVSLNDFVEKNIHQHYKKLYLNLEIKEYQFSNNEFEGQFNFYPSFKYDYLINNEVSLDADYRSYEHECIDVYLHGVFVERVTTVLINRVLGNINFKQSLELNLARNNSSDSQIFKSLFNVELKIANEILEKLREKASYYEAWMEFSEKYLSYRFHFSAEDESFDVLYDFFKENMVLKVLIENQEKYCRYNEIMEFRAFHFTENEEFGKLISKSTSNPIIVLDSFVGSLIKYLLVEDKYQKYYEKIETFYLELYVQNLSSKTKNEKYGITEVYNFSDTEKAFIVVGFWDNGFTEMEYDMVLNKNYPLVKFLVDRCISNNSSESDKVFAIKQLRNLENRFSFYISIQGDQENNRINMEERINEELRNINDYFKTDFSFSEKDIQEEVLIFFDQRNSKTLKDV